MRSPPSTSHRDDAVPRVQVGDGDAGERPGLGDLEHLAVRHGEDVGADVASEVDGVEVAAEEVGEGAALTLRRAEPRPVAAEGESERRGVGVLRVGVSAPVLDVAVDLGGGLGKGRGVEDDPGGKEEDERDARALVTVVVDRPTGRKATPSRSSTGWSYTVTCHTRCALEAFTTERVRSSGFTPRRGRERPRRAGNRADRSSRAQAPTEETRRAR